ncbi:exodeoxyribonuclease VII large subunit [Mesobacillus campisalis]|uniref:Exodeoxyribonuclease 7 large subunit n=1 Tax=Mesobacillus campisalis TaxID=1408103 RepID=A0A0M2SHY4_9BACI|nr:exodeoxyribonuclease VII large subunit [Mesobacillus campisalis]KKK33241.1 exodeoxyribonuclease VII large subunit [Mesobacillus campisalis]
MDEHRYLTVHALTKYIKRKFDADPHLQDIFVKGEISNFKQHSSGHMYFTLKDEKARILAVMFSSFNKGMKFRPENGMKILIRGEITVYEPSGQYQVYVKEMQPDGVGDLFLAYEQLKARLEKEGLFLPRYKKPLPKYPQKVGVITSPTGAAIRDVLTTLKRRYPITDILIIPALVQGSQGAASIVRAIETANRRSGIDVLIVGRGGGSIEELWSFNEEAVARAIFASRIPVISAVGHETDFTIADFVADMRAPTPTAAAELAVPHIDDLMEKVLNRQSRLIRAMKEKVNFEQGRYGRLKKSYAFRFPRRLYEQKLEQVDRLTETLVKGAGKLAETKAESLLHLTRRLERNHPEELLKHSREAHQRQERELKRAMAAILSEKQQEFAGLVSTLEALNPLKIMERGYSLAYTEEGSLIKRPSQVKANDSLTVKLPDGQINCIVKNVEESEQNGRG